MRRGTIFAAVVIALLGVVGSAQAGAPDGAAGPWADYVVDSHQGFALQGATGIPGGAFLPGRSDPTAALGPAESPPGNDPNPPPGTFFSLGFGGDITLGFDNPICNQPGTDLAIDVREITIENYPPERAQVYVSENGVTFLLAGTVTKDGTVPMPAGLTVANFVKLIDVSVPADFIGRPNNPDGFDLDGVRALNSSCPPGKIEICKAAANGMYNRPFQFSLNGGAPFTVRGGRCSGPITTIPGLNTVVELPTTPPTDVSAISVRPSTRLISQDLPNRRAVVRVVSGSTAASESKVTFTNEPGGGTTGELKICKVTESPQYVGRSFSFRVNGGPLFSTEANFAFDGASSWSCRLAGSFAVGTRITVKEEIPAGAEIGYIDSNPADRLIDFDMNVGTAYIEIGSGVTIVTYDNEPIPPAESGYLEVCKDASRVYIDLPEDRGIYAGDPFVTGPFTFTVTPPDGNQFDVDVHVGQCTAPLLVAAGVVRVTEHPRLNHTLVDAYTIPEERLLDSNLINGTADVEVPTSSDPNDETQLHFVNRRDRGQLKVCKALGPGSAALSGERFYFDVRLLGDIQDSLAPGVSIIALAGSTQCVIVDDFPVGEQVTVDEVFGLNYGDGGLPSLLTDEYIDVSGEVTSANPLTIGPGINTVTITNTAVGLLEICKARVDGLNTQPFFRFRVDGGGIISIRAGTCKPAMRVSVGEHTIVELAESYFELDPNALGGGITVTPPEREVSKNLALRTIRVSVPFGADGETRVDFYNRIKRADVKICKEVPAGSLDTLGTTQFTYSYSVNRGLARRVPGSIRNGECVLLPESIPVLQANGTASVVELDEIEAGPAGIPGLHVSFAYQGSGAVSQGDPCNGTITISPLGVGMNHVTFINQKLTTPCVANHD